MAARFHVGGGKGSEMVADIVLGSKRGFSASLGVTWALVIVLEVLLVIGVSAGERARSPSRGLAVPSGRALAQSLVGIPMAPDLQRAPAGCRAM